MHVHVIGREMRYEGEMSGRLQIGLANQRNESAYDVVVLSIHILQHARRSPSAPKNHNGLLVLIEGLLLRRWVCFLCGQVEECGCRAEDGDEGDPTERGQRPTPSWRFWEDILNPDSASASRCCE